MWPGPAPSPNHPIPITLRPTYTHVYSPYLNKYYLYSRVTEPKFLHKNRKIFKQNHVIN